jgi:hypothetical protein
MTKQDRIQHLIITQLLKEGSVQLKLPDGITLELGITQEGKDGRQEKCDNYCWVTTSQHQRRIFMDSFNLSMEYAATDKQIVLEDNIEDEDGRVFHVVDVV